MEKRLVRRGVKEKVLIREMKMKKKIVKNCKKNTKYEKVDAAMNIRNNYKAYGGREKRNRLRKRTS